MQGGLGTRKKLGELLTDTSAYPNVLPEIKKAILENAILLITLSKKGAWAPLRNTAKTVVQTVNILGVPTAVVAAGVFATLAAIPVIGLGVAILGGLLALAGSAVVGSILFAAVGEGVGFPEDTKADIRKWKAGVLETTQKTLAKYDAMDPSKQKEEYEKAKAKAEAEIAKATENVKNDEKKKADLRSSALAADAAIPNSEEALQEAKKEEVNVGLKATDMYVKFTPAPKQSTVLPTARQSKVSNVLPPAPDSLPPPGARFAGGSSRRRRPRRKSSTRRR
jgi:hypothetical protein